MDRKCSDEETVGLGGLSARQRRVVERNLALVHYTLKRHTSLCQNGRPGREAPELIQEGMIALIEAVRAHEPHRHGHFGPYAMSRIHFAMSRYAHEQSGLVRVPFITQRRARKRRADEVAERGETNDRQGGRGAADHGGRIDAVAAREAAARRSRCHINGTDGDGDSVGEMIRERIDAAIDASAGELHARAKTIGSARNVIDRCHRERWTIPEAESKTPIREMSRSLDCSLGRITHTEAKFRKLVGRRLRGDEEFLALERLAKSDPEGMRRRLSDDERAELRLAANRRKADPR